MDRSDFLFSIVDTPDGPATFITGKDIWENKGIMSQGFNDQEMKILDPILERAGLSELMESSYEMAKAPDETKEILLEEGLMEDKNFDKYIMREYH